MNKNLLILGAGQYGTVAREIAQSMQCFEKIEFLDDCYGTDSAFYHEETVGRFCDYEGFAGEYSYAIVAVGNPEHRQKQMEKLKEAGFRIPVLVSPKAYVSPSVQLRMGCIVESFAGINANVVVGEGTIISMGAMVDHNSVVMDFCHIDCGAVVESGALVGRGMTVAAGMVFKRESSKIMAETLLKSVTCCGL